VGHQLATMIRSIASTDATSQEALLLYASLSAAAHDNALRDAINAQIAELRQALTAHTDTGRAQLIAAARDGLIMQRSFGIGIDGVDLSPAVRRILDVWRAGSSAPLTRRTGTPLRARPGSRHHRPMTGSCPNPPVGPLRRIRSNRVHQHSPRRSG